MKEYTLKIATRDSDNPLIENILIEFGVTDQVAFAKAATGLIGMLQHFKSPEKTAEYIRDHAAMSQAQHLLSKG